MKKTTNNDEESNECGKEKGCRDDRHTDSLVRYMVCVCFVRFMHM